MNGRRFRRRMPMRASMLALLLLVAASASAQGAPDKLREWKLSTAVGPVFALGNAGDRWAKLIEERSGGKFLVKVHPGATLADRDPAREFVALRDGAADLAIGSTLFWSAQVPELNVVGLPWLASDGKGLDALVAGTMKERLDAAIERAGAVPLAYATLGLRALATTSAAVQMPADLAGLKVRIASTPVLADLFFALGAEPRTMPFADAQAALKAGNLAAQEGTPATFVAARLDALGVRHVVLWGAIAEVAVFAVNRASWAGLTLEQRAIVSDAAQQTARELPELARVENEAALAELRRRGATVTRLTASGRAAFAFAARSAYEKWAAIASPEITRAAEAAIAAAPP
jgi:TRAP-type C4-dicarboxylate transport system substrate-binding protein